MSSSLLAKGAAWVPMQWVRLLSGVPLVVPFYHMVSDDHVPHVSNLYRFRSVAEFTADVEFFARNFEPVTLDDIVDALNGSRPLRRSCCHLTFDDGFREMYDVAAPILQRAGVPATFFLNTAFLDRGGLAHYNVLSVLIDRIESHPSGASAARARLEAVLPPATSRSVSFRERMLSIGYPKRSLVSELGTLLDFDLQEYISQVRPILSSEEVQGLAQKGFTIGSHSHDHLLYAELPLQGQLAQTRISTELLETRFGLKPKAFAFPHNDNGVQREFFTSVFSDRLVDVCFGTSGLVPHFHPRNIQRVTMENTAAPAGHILARQFTRATYRRFILPSKYASPS
jgi:peptidoglycan/xylan/chitin deacetylase (PgdA/CDA1 family)